MAETLSVQSVAKFMKIWRPWYVQSGVVNRWSWLIPRAHDACKNYFPYCHIYAELGHNRFRQWLVVCSVPIHCLNQWWFVINHTTRNKFPASINSLTHWGRNKMAAVSQTTFSNAFSWMKMYEFWLKFRWSLFLSVQLTVSHHWLR